MSKNNKPNEEGRTVARGSASHVDVMAALEQQRTDNALQAKLDKKKRVELAKAYGRGDTVGTPEGVGEVKFVNGHGGVEVALGRKQKGFAAELVTLIKKKGD